MACLPVGENRSAGPIATLLLILIDVHPLVARGSRAVRPVEVTGIVTSSERVETDRGKANDNSQ
jgi:hypothetical protein